MPMTIYEHVFQDSWTEKWPWLFRQWDKMMCRLCVKHKKTNVLTTGSTNYRTSTLERHVDCRDHREALRAEALSKEFSQAASSAIKKYTAEPGVCIKFILNNLLIIIGF